MDGETLVLIAVLAPFAAALLTRSGPGLPASAWAYGGALAALLASAALYPAVRAGQGPVVELIPLVPGAGLTLRVDGLGLTFGLLASGLWCLAAVYNAGYARASAMANEPRYFAAFAASVGAATGVAYAGNVVTFLIFYELLTLTTYPLVTHDETEKAIDAGRRYLCYALAGGLFLTIAAAWTWALPGVSGEGRLDFVPGGFLAGQSPTVLATLFLLYLLGVGVKAGIMPLHAWLPAAMVAPTPVSALLHAVAVVKAGVFGCIRVIGYVFGPEALGQAGAASSVLVAVCAATILIGSFIAVRQDHLKRRLAYSTIVHLSYIVLGAALLTPVATVGALLHLVNHGLTKITLFFCAGAIHVGAHADYVSEMRGLGRRMPWTFGAFAVAALSLTGVPGLCGFVSKLTLARGAVAAEEYVALGVLLGASLFTAAYLFPVVRVAFFEEPDPHHDEGHHAADSHHDEAHHAGEPPPSLLLPLLGTAGLTAVFGVVPFVLNGQRGLAETAATAIFGGGS